MVKMARVIRAAMQVDDGSGSADRWVAWGSMEAALEVRRAGQHVLFVSPPGEARQPGV